MVVLAGERQQGNTTPFMSKHLVVIALGCLILLGRDYIFTGHGSEKKEAVVPVETESVGEGESIAASTINVKGGGGQEELAIDKSLEVPEGSMHFLETVTSGKSMQRTFMEENSKGHKVHISFCSS